MFIQVYNLFRKCTSGFYYCLKESLSYFMLIEWFLVIVDLLISQDFK